MEWDLNREKPNENWDKQEKIGLKRTKEKHSWRVDNWMKVIFSDESRFSIDQGDDTEAFIGRRSNKTKMTVRRK